MLNGAEEVLDSLETEHRHDLAIHLYSTHLLKELLWRANGKRHPYEVDQVLRTQLKDNWTSWPGTHARRPPIDYEEGGESHRDSNPLTDSIHSMQLEFNALWQRMYRQSQLKEKKESGQNSLELDVDFLDMPKQWQGDLLDRLDLLFEGLHYKMAVKNATQIDGKANFSLSEDNGQVKHNRRIQMDYHDILARACEVHPDVRYDDVYMKSLELYNDIPHQLKKHKFKLPKQMLEKYEMQQSETTDLNNPDDVLQKSREPYWLLEKLVRDKRFTAAQKMHWKALYRKSNIRNQNLKLISEIQGPPSLGYEELSADDFLIKIPRN